MAKIKPLLPSLRQKKRYLAFEIIADKKLEVSQIKTELFNKIKDFLGEFTLSKANLDLVEAKGNKAILKVSNKYADILRSALILVKNINKEAVLIRTLILSGSIQKAKNYI
ncbi:MAG TPA: Rpp14/Pop5 family protein [Candidatus Nanoarchaeia archaeon]|nr:Rpp14/Pop5 family protein [Candidatus Nanoarchaeia archaeon]